MLSSLFAGGGEGLDSRDGSERVGGGDGRDSRDGSDRTGGGDGRDSRDGSDRTGGGDGRDSRDGSDRTGGAGRRSCCGLYIGSDFGGITRTGGAEGRWVSVSRGLYTGLSFRRSSNPGFIPGVSTVRGGIVGRETDPVFLGRSPLGTGAFGAEVGTGGTTGVRPPRIVVLRSTVSIPSLPVLGAAPVLAVVFIERDSTIGRETLAFCIAESTLSGKVGIDVVSAGKTETVVLAICALGRTKLREPLPN